MQVETLHSRLHRQAPTMTSLSQIYMVILIIVFVVHQIQAADKDNEKTMRELSKRLRKSRRKLIRQGPTYRINTNRLSRLLQLRQAYVPSGSPLKLDQLSQNPDPGNSIEWQTYVMEYNAYQFELCHIYHVLTSNGLIDLRVNLLADGGARDYSFERKEDALVRHSGTLKSLMRGYLVSEVKHAIVSDVVAPHIDIIVSTHGDDLALLINEMRHERLSLAKRINAINANKILVSLENATDDSDLERKSPSPSMVEPPMAPASHMSGAVLHYIMEYNGLMFMKYKLKSVQLTKVLNNVLTPPECRPELENKQKQVLAEMKTYLGTAYKYAEKLTERALHSFGYGKACPPSSDLMDVPGAGNDDYNSEENAPVALSESVQPEGPSEQDFDADLNAEDWDMVLPLLEDSRDSPPLFHPSVVGNQVSTGPYQPIRQDVVYESSPAVDAIGSEENPHHLDFGLSQLNEAEVMWSAPMHHPIPYADEAGSSRKGQCCSFGPFPSHRCAGITPDFIQYTSKNISVLITGDHVRESVSQFSVA
ncbi:hypothetical protein SeLEV6574_g04313 [Synchytrium endobioticum]|uniref:Uncharacterized protein n=1 Tax=Synchytrium endobioticum TaxID=286115 RepID=A0A507D008_9FUNG|nr:hypothetical protein SeLEV6574_g04313 [Synchytrium endobioticum]